MSTQQSTSELTLMEEVNRLKEENSSLKKQVNNLEIQHSILTEENQLLRVFEEDYKAISEQTLVGILISQNNRYVFVSDGFTQITERSVSSILNMTTNDILDIIHPADQEKVAIVSKQREQTNGVFNLLFRLRKKNGGYVWLETWSKGITYRGKKASIITYVDVTEKQKYQDQIHKSKELYSNLFAHSPTGLLFADKEGNILEANNKIVSMMGSPSMEATKSINLFKFQPIIDCGFADLLKRSIEEGGHFSGTTFYTTKWGVKLWVNYHFDPIKDTQGNVSGTLINFIDVTEEHKNKIALEESELKLNKIFQSSPSAIAVINKNGYVINCNERQVALLGFTSKNDLIGKHTSKLLSQKNYQEIKRRIVNCSKSNHRIQNYECVLSNKNSEFYAEISGGMILDNRQKPVNFIAVTHDITQRKQNEKELILAKNKAEESDRLKTAFLENMSHEVRTPLNGIIGFLDILSDDDVSQDEKTEYTDIIHNCAGQLLNIINDILDVSKISSGQLSTKFDWVNISDFIHELESYYQSENSSLIKSDATISFTSDIAEQDQRIYTDIERLRQVFTNLINNALKFCKKGKITISFSHSYELGYNCCVKDTGIGIPADKQKIIFQRFRQVDESINRQYGGTGLGLAICKSIVNILGGVIWVNSTVGKGSEFHFTLPDSDSPYDAFHYNKLDQVKSKVNLKKILLITPNIKTHAYLCEIFQDLKIKVEITRTIPSKNKKDFDLIIVSNYLETYNDDQLTSIRSFYPHTTIAIFQTHKSDFKQFNDKTHFFSNTLTKENLSKAILRVKNI